MSRTTLARRHALLGLAACALPLPSWAQTASPRSYAALSLVGDGMTIVQYQGQTGSHVDQSERDTIPLAEPVIDEHVLLTLDRELKKLVPEGAQLIVPSGPQHYAKQRDFFDGERFVPNAALEPALKALKETHLLLITRHRSSGGLRGLNTPSGARTLEGLGFYIDTKWREKRGNLITVSSGLLAPYAHIRVSLIELATRKVIKHEVIVASEILHTPPGFQHPWDSVDTKTKIGSLSELLEREIVRVLPGLLAG